MNCEANAELCSEHGITHYPTIKLVVGGTVKPYEGNVDIKALQEFVQEAMPSDAIANVRRAQQATELLASANKKKRTAAMLFTSKFDTSAMFKSLAFSFKDSIMFGEVRASNAAVSDRFGVGKYPVLLVFCGGDESQVVEYHGEHKAKELREFLTSVKDLWSCMDAAKTSKRSPPREKPKIDPDTDFSSMRVSELKKMLDEQGEECVGCVEKADYIRKLQAVARR